MNYQETLDYLFNALPMFQRVGASAYKADLTNTIALCTQLGNPQNYFKSIHVAGTNGKGSTSHSLASIFQSAGYKTGLYTSPHLKAFTERIRINGDEINKDDVVEFIATHKNFLDQLQPSFFEMTVGLAFWYFAKEEVDIAIIEVGMGGRLDSTNVISPELCVITNIGFDHTQFLGDTLPLIAGEKAGIIKQGVPVVISHTQQEIQSVFLQKAASMEANLVFADQQWEVNRTQNPDASQLARFQVKGRSDAFELEFGLRGDYQRYNLPGILEAVEQMRKQGWNLTKEALHLGLAGVSELTGLKGRWQILNVAPRVICDTAHNKEGLYYVMHQLASLPAKKLHIVLGVVTDKKLEEILPLFPQDASYYFCKPTLFY